MRNFFCNGHDPKLMLIGEGGIEVQHLLTFFFFPCTVKHFSVHPNFVRQSEVRLLGRWLGGITSHLV